MKRAVMNFSRKDASFIYHPAQFRHLFSTVTCNHNVSCIPAECFNLNSWKCCKQHCYRLPFLCTQLLISQRLKPVILRKYRKYNTSLGKLSSDLSNEAMKETVPLNSFDSENVSTSLIAEMFLQNVKEETQETYSQIEKKSDSELDQMLFDLEQGSEIHDIAESKEDETVLQFLEREKHEEGNKTDGESEDYVEKIDLESNPFLKGGLPETDVPCSGCGAYFQCNTPNAPGYMPVDKFAKIKHWQLWQHICSRCIQMKVRKKCLESSVSPEEYLQIIKEVKDIHALVLVVVDLTDLPHSIFPNLAEVIGKNRPIYIVGNKVDLLPNDSKDYLARVKNTLKTMVEDAGLTSDNYVNHYALVSGKTGYGIEEFITHTFGSWKRKGNNLNH